MRPPQVGASLPWEGECVDERGTIGCTVKTDAVVAGVRADDACTTCTPACRFLQVGGVCVGCFVAMALIVSVFTCGNMDGRACRHHILPDDGVGLGSHCAVQRGRGDAYGVDR